jgi:hypothetical protein
VTLWEPTESASKQHTQPQRGGIQQILSIPSISSILSKE